MRARATHRYWFLLRVLVLVGLCVAGFVGGQPLSPPAGAAPPPSLVMVARVDPADPARYIGVFGDDLSEAAAIYRSGRRLRTTVPYLLQRGDEIETKPDVIAVLRYPNGDVYVSGATRARIGSLDVLFGKVFARVRGLFSVEGQNVVAGVEGTEFAFEVGTNKEVHVTVLDGNVLCSSRTLPWRPVRIAREQAFALVAGGRELRVGPANPTELAQLRSWVQTVDDAVLPPPRPQPQPQPVPVPPPPSPTPAPFEPQPGPGPVLPPVPPSPIQPPPIFVPPVFPVPTTPLAYCCEAGRVFRTTPEGCRGRLYGTQAEAYERCRPVTMGYCCANGRVFPSAAENCRGNFSLDQADARASCAAPLPQPRPGFCCAGGEVSPATRDQCRGSFFTDEASARKRCAVPPPMGYCCAGGEVAQTTREQCRGRYFADQASARKSCTAPPEQGYCCAGGKVSATTRDRCTGSFSRLQEDAQRTCKRQSEIRVQKGIVKSLPPSDAPR